MGKARVTTDKRTGNLIVRAYGGKDPATGKVYAPSKTLPGDASDEEIASAIAFVELRSGMAQNGVAGYQIGTLVDYYLDGLIDYGKSPTTVAAYRSITRCYVKPYIGKLLFDRAKASDFAGLYRHLLRKGGRDGGPLSVQTIKKLHAFLSGCFSTLVKDGVVTTNPVRGIPVPRGESPEAKPLSEYDFALLANWIKTTLAKTVKDDESFYLRSFAAALWTCLHTGVRRGELAGFRIGDYIHNNIKNETSASLRVSTALIEVKNGDVFRKAPKSTKGKRTLALDDTTAQVIDDNLSIQRVVLAEHQVSISKDTPLFTHACGKPIKPSEYTSGFHKLAKELKLTRGVHLHTLRHTHASYLLEAGEHIKAIQERLGHSTIDITLNIYGHLMPGRDAKAAQRFGEVSENIVQQSHNDAGVLYAPKCPLSGNTCVRYLKNVGTCNA